MRKEKYRILRDREGMMAPVYWTPVSVTSSWAKELYQVCISRQRQIYADGRLQAVHYAEDFDRVESYIAAKFYSDDNYFNRIASEIKRREKILWNIFAKLEKIKFNELKNEKLISMAIEMKNKWQYYESANILGWAYAADRLSDLVKKTININKSDFAILSTPETKTYVSQLEDELIVACAEILEGKTEINKRAEKLAYKYGYIPHGFDGPEIWDKKYFLGKLSELAHKYSADHRAKLKEIQVNNTKLLDRRDVVIKKHQLCFEDIKLINKLNTTAVWTDERKYLMFRLYFYYHQVLFELERRYNIPFKNLKHLFTEELYEVLIDAKRVKIITDQRIQNGVVVEYTEDKFRIISSKDQNDFLGEINSIKAGSEIKGKVASRGDQDKYEGQVKILMSARDNNKINDGDWLAATMTTPDYVPAMKKAAGFITDEGGVTCHAAIISREMDKPCIIGTGNATKILKDGDKIEVDAEKGTVKVIK